MSAKAGIKTKQTGTLWIGTSNIVLPLTKNNFPPAFQTGSRLTYYASLFNTLEVNSSFYKVPMPKTFERWGAEAGPSFRFSVKLWKEVTHGKPPVTRLADIDSFMKAANWLPTTNRGCLLVQFPAGTRATELARVEKLLKRLKKKNSSNSWQPCVEFRHPDWYNANTYALLDEYDAGLVLHDMPKSIITSLETTAPVVYLRFHGVAGDYRGTYENTLLAEYARNIKQWLKQGKDVYAYFNNTLGEAYQNAIELRRLCE